MKAAHVERLRRLPSAVRDRVLERACILHESGVARTWDEADDMAMRMEAPHQRALFEGD